MKIHLLPLLHLRKSKSQPQAAKHQARSGPLNHLLLQASGAQAAASGPLHHPARTRGHLKLHPAAAAAANGHPKPQVANGHHKLRLSHLRPHRLRKSKSGLSQLLRLAQHGKLLLLPARLQATTTEEAAQAVTSLDKPPGSHRMATQELAVSTTLIQTTL